jgi:RimJ/RimL family protein N-acetyltransferase
MIGDKKSWNRGYGTEAMQLVIDYAFNTLNLNRVYSTTIIDNKGAIKSSEKVGMEREGLFKQFRFINGKFTDVVQYAITRDRYMRKTKKRL